MAQAIQKPILISGAGLASLLLAQSLRRASIPFIVFERDKSFTFRGQGYRLRLSSEGLDAVESVLEPDHWRRFWDACGKTAGKGLTTLNAVTAEEIPNDGPPQPAPSQGAPQAPPQASMKLESRDGKTIGISRGDMRTIFAAGCEDSIIWDTAVTGYELTPTGVHAIFADGSKSVEGDMLIGGEGIHSKVAVQLSEGKLKVYDSGARGIHGQAPITAFKGLGEGVWMIRDQVESRKAFVITNVRPGPLDDPNQQFGWTMGGTPGCIEAPNNDDEIIGVSAAKIAKSLSEKWHPRIKPLFENMDESQAAFWKITCSSPDGVPEWNNQPRVTVIGDAVHSMTPAGGLGANTAMRDSALLGKLIAEAGGYAPHLTAAYEKVMRVYGSETVKISYGMACRQFGIHIDEKSATVNGT